MNSSRSMKSLLKRIPFASRAAQLLRFTFDPVEREFRRLRKGNAPLLFQPSAFTQCNRYPQLFGFVRHHLERIATPNIMSYGCATGEEVFSLLGYCPTARIKGLDINPACIRICDRRLARAPNAAIRFECAGSPDNEPADHYDAIFCMAVTRHGSLDALKPARCDPTLDFADFERLAISLTRCLRAGGLLIIWHSNFRLADTCVANQFDVVMHHRPGNPQARSFFGRDNRRLEDSSYSEAIFRKSANE